MRFSEALQRRFDIAMDRAIARGVGACAEHFKALAAGSKAVLCRSPEETVRLATSDTEAYVSYEALLHAGARLADGHWTRLRLMAGIELFGAGSMQFQFAALSLDGSGVDSYGDAIWELSERMIAARATVFERNSAVFFEDARKRGDEPPLTEGFCAAWERRSTLAVAKHADELQAGMDLSEFQRLILHVGPTSREDVFIEVHVHGTLTRRSLSRVSIKAKDFPRYQIANLRRRLGDIGVELEVRST